MKATAYGGMERELARQLREAALDHDAFELKLKVCELSQCRATCCHDGVILCDEEVAIIAELVESKRDELLQFGWNHEDFLVESGGSKRSVTLEAGDDDLPEGFPVHFPKTRCVFLDEEHRCVLQRLAMEEGRHPWFWKPISCWMHPLILRPGESGDRPVLTLARPGNDPAAGPGYPGFSSSTPCGMAQISGAPAWEALRPELELLGSIGGRDLIGELSGDSTDNRMR